MRLENKSQALLCLAAVVSHQERLWGGVGASAASDGGAQVPSPLPQRVFNYTLKLPSLEQHLQAICGGGGWEL